MAFYIVRAAVYEEPNERSSGQTCRTSAERLAVERWREAPPSPFGLSIICLTVACGGLSDEYGDDDEDDDVDDQGDGDGSGISF